MTGIAPRDFSKIAALTALYVVTARFGLYFQPFGGFATLIWPPTGIALSALLLFGMRLAPGIFFGALIANLWQGAPLPVALGIAAGNLLEAVAAFWALKKFSDFDAAFDRIKDVLGLIWFAAIGSTLVAATVGASSLFAGGIIDGTAYARTWAAWWLGDLASDLILVPLILVWWAARRSGRLALIENRRNEAAAFLFLIAVASFIIFRNPFAFPLQTYALPFILLPLLLLAAVRFCQIGAATGTAVIAGIAVWSTLDGIGPFVVEHGIVDLFAVQIFHGILAIASLVVAATFSERQISRAETIFAQYSHFARSTALFAVATPIFLLGSLNMAQIHRDLTTTALAERQVVAELAARTLRGQFDRLTQIARAASERTLLVDLAAQGHWDAAIELLRPLTKEYRDIDRVVLVDAAGTLKADAPALPEARGKNFSYHDWYLGVAKSRKAYISETYRRTAEPALNVIGIAIPLIPPGGSQNMLGIALFQVRLDRLLEWTRDVNFGAQAYSYFADQNGHMVGHPGHPAQGEIVSFLNDETVSRALRGERGARTMRDASGEQLIAYEPVAPYGWGAFVAQDAAVAFGARNRALTSNSILYGLVLLLAIFVMLLLARLQEKLAEQTERFEEKIGEKTREFAEVRARDEAFLMGMGEGVVAVDENGVILLVNRKFEELTGRGAGEAIGKSFAEAVPQETDGGKPVAFRERMLLPVITHPEATREISSSVVRKDQRRFPALFTVAAIVIDHQVRGAVLTFRDTSKERELARSRNEFITIASHQLRTPLTAIRWAVERLFKTERAVSVRGTEYLANIHAAATNLGTLVDDLLNVSRIETGGIRIEPEPIAVAAHLASCLKEFTALITKKNLKLIVNPVPQKFTVATDPNAFRNIVRSLIANAVDYTRDGGTIEIGMTEHGERFLFSVRDTGIGIPKEEQARVFEKYFRGANARREKTGGTGIGLYIATESAKVLGGTIRFESVEGRGTTFVADLPIRSAARPGARELV